MAGDMPGGMASKILAALPPLLAIGCGHDYTIHPTVAIDSDFSGYELEQVMAAMNNWEGNTPATFDVRWVDHADLAAGRVFSSSADVIMYRMPTKTDMSCPVQGDVTMQYDWVADTVTVSPGQVVICFDAVEMLVADTQRPGTYLGSVTHELGHAMGLEHVAASPDSPAVMFWRTGPSYSATLTCTDLAEFADLWPSEYRLPASCKGATYQLFH